MQTQHNKARPPRIEREEPEEILAEDQTSWAVSYSDLLMVLMSFFVVFFSFDDSNHSSLVEQIAQSFRIQPATGGRSTEIIENRSYEGAGKSGNAGTGSGTGKESGTGTGAGSGAGKGAGNLQGSDSTQVSRDTVMGLGASISASLSKLSAPGVKVETAPDTINVEFPENVYGPGKYHMTTETKNLVSALLEIIEPFNGQLDLIFVGHADQAAVRRKDSVITDNFILSSLRASKALEYAVSKGFPQERAFAQGAASNISNSRGLSVRIHVKRSAE